SPKQDRHRRPEVAWGTTSRCPRDNGRRASGTPRLHEGLALEEAARERVGAAAAVCAEEAGRRLAASQLAEAEGRADRGRGVADPSRGLDRQRGTAIGETRDGAVTIRGDAAAAAAALVAGRRRLRQQRTGGDVTSAAGRAAAEIAAALAGASARRT